MQKNSKSILLLAAFNFIIPLLLLYSYNYYGKPIVIFGIELKMLTNQSKEPDQVTKKSLQINKELKFRYKVKIPNFKNDSIKQKKQIDGTYSINDTIQFERYLTDSSGQRILIMGDSECGGLFHELNDYCVQNKHELVMTFVWNSSTILNFAYSDTVVEIINKYKPTYIFIVLGLNELYAKDIKIRKKAADVLAKKLDGIPYSWIGPANYMNDYGINNVFYSAAQPGTFFLSKDLNLPKGRDNRHPNATGYRIWMDTIASWVETKAKYPLVMNVPKKRNTRFRSKIINLNAAIYRGY